MTDKDNVKKQYENYKKQLDKINDRYSETYVKPETDMPDSLGLKTVDYKMPSEDELRKKAETALEADRQSAISKIGKETEEKIKKQSALKEQAFAEAAKRLLDIDSEREQAVREVKNDALARNIARSSIASEGVRETEERGGCAAPRRSSGTGRNCGGDRQRNRSLEKASLRFPFPNGKKLSFKARSGDGKTERKGVGRKNGSGKIQQYRS